jgi:hypothetical protein
MQDIDITDIAFSNIDGIVKYLSSKMKGVNPSIIKLTIAIALKHYELIDGCLIGIADTLKLNPDLLSGLFSIATCGFNRQNTSKDDLFGKLEYGIKKLFHALQPDLIVQDSLGEISRVIFKRDYESLIYSLENLTENNSDAFKVVDDIVGGGQDSSSGSF